MKFSITELLQAGSHKWKLSDVDTVTRRNLQDLCCKINALGYVPAMRASSCLRSIKDQQRINPNAMGSSHLYGCAVDISDPKGELARWLETHRDTLVLCGLWQEDPMYTKGWVHLQTYRPNSGKRVFIP